ncbi:ankyrin repeat-containing domain protein [Biscogniauxia sp. FL1348]|nr:ankyrin repeat-containing domain protein [Biscogniauxia sp. FL1348]
MYSQLLRFLESLPSPHQSSNALLPLFRGNLLTCAAGSIQSTIDAFLPTSAIKDEVFGSNLAIESVNRMGPAQAINLIAFMVSNNVSSSFNCHKAYRWLKKQGMAHETIFHTLKGPSADALLENLFRLAVEDQDVPMVEDLLRAGVDPNSSTCYMSKNFSSLTPLQFACLMGNLPLVDKLIKAGAKVNNTESGWRGNILVLVIYYWGGKIYAIRKSKLWNEQYCLSEEDNELDLLEIVEVLVAAGAEVNPSGPTSMNDEDSGMVFLDTFDMTFIGNHSPLTIAATLWLENVVEFLIQKNADVRFRVNGLRSALRESLYSLQYEGSILYPVKNEGPADLSGPEHNNMIHVVQSLINARAELDDHVPCTDDNCDHDSCECYSVLDLATFIKSVELIDIMISAGAVATKESPDFAFDNRSFDIYCRLVDVGDDVLAKSTLKSSRAHILDRQKKRALVLMAVRCGRASYIKAIRMSDDRTLIDNPDSWEFVRIALENCKCPKTWRYLIDSNILGGILRSRALNFLLCESIEKRYDDEVEFLLAAGADINTAEPEPPTLLAIRSNNFPLVQKLIQAGATLESQTPPGHHVYGWGSLLVEAIQQGNDAMVEEVIRAGVNINCLGTNSPFSSDFCKCCSPLSMAIQMRNWTLVDHLRSLRASVNPSCTDPGQHHCQTPLWAAAAGRYWTLVRSLVNDGAEVNDCAALRSMVEDYETLEFCVQKLRTGNYIGQKLNAVQLGLAEALSRGSLTRSAELLIQSGLADVKAFSDNKTPLYQVLTSEKDGKERRNHLLCLLLEGGADPNSVACRYWQKGLCRWETALEVAIRVRDLDSVLTLLRYGASVNQQPEEGVLYFPVQRAAHTGNKEILRVILETCDDPNAVSPWGQRLYPNTRDNPSIYLNTPVWAVEMGRLEPPFKALQNGESLK